MAHAFAVGPSSDYRTKIDELLDLARRRPAWHADALCKEHPEIDFYPERGQATEPAKRICEQCAVRAECTAAALEEDHGIWGGTSARDRRRTRRLAILSGQRVRTVSPSMVGQPRRSA